MRKLIWRERDGSIVCDDFKDRSRYVVREKGEWIDWAKHHGVVFFHHGIRSVGVVCSLCNKLSDNKFDFCPNCGADMRGAVCDACT